MYIQFLQVAAFAVSVVGATGAFIYFCVLWKLSRDTTIEPIVSEGAQK